MKLLAKITAENPCWCDSKNNPLLCFVGLSIADCVTHETTTNWMILLNSFLESVCRSFTEMWGDQIYCFCRYVVDLCSRNLAEAVITECVLRWVNKGHRVFSDIRLVRKPCWTYPKRCSHWSLRTWCCWTRGMDRIDKAGVCHVDFCNLERSKPRALKRSQEQQESYLLVSGSGQCQNTSNTLRCQL